MKLEKGMVIYALGKHMRKLVIDRTTPKQAIIIEDNDTNKIERRFKREIDPDYNFREIGKDVWSGGYRVSTPELDNKYRMQMLVACASNIELKSLSEEKLQAIIKIAEGKELEI